MTVLKFNEWMNHPLWIKLQAVTPMGCNFFFKLIFSLLEGYYSWIKSRLNLIHFQASSPLFIVPFWLHIYCVEDQCFSGHRYLTTYIDSNKILNMFSSTCYCTINNPWYSHKLNPRTGLLTVVIHNECSSSQVCHRLFMSIG